MRKKIEIYKTAAFSNVDIKKRAVKSRQPSVRRIKLPLAHL